MSPLTHYVNDRHPLANPLYNTRQSTHPLDNDQSLSCILTVIWWLVIHQVPYMNGARGGLLIRIVFDRSLVGGKLGSTVRSVVSHWVRSGKGMDSFTP